MGATLAGWRILVVNAEVGGNLLATRLSQAGATVVDFPRVKPAPPHDLLALIALSKELERFHWVVFSGRHSVVHFFSAGAARLSELGDDRPKIAAIGAGTSAELQRRAIQVDLRPDVHTAAGVARALGEVAGRRILLIREETATRELPEHLRTAGAAVREAAGFRTVIELDSGQVTTAFATRSDLVALGNPTAVRLLFRAAHQAGINLVTCLGGTPIAAVGPETAAAASRFGLDPDLVSAGRLADLVRDLEELVGRGRD